MAFDCKWELIYSITLKIIKMKEVFKSNKTGFSMTFENGWTISVQFGHGNYCENKNHPNGMYFAEDKKIVESSTAEIGIWDENNEWYDFGDDVVKGWVKPSEVADWISKVSKFNKPNQSL